MPPGYWLEMAGFGIVGFDPTVALITAASLVTGVPRRQVGVFLITALGGSYLAGVGLAGLSAAFLPQERLRQVLADFQSSPLRSVVEAIVAVSVLIWLAIRLVRHTTAERQGAASLRGTAAAIGLGVGVAAAWVFDPGFIGGVAIAAGTHSPIGIAVGLLLWLAIAQSLTFVVLAAMVIWSPQVFADRFARTWARLAPYRAIALNVLLGAVAIGLLIDAVVYWSTGHYPFGH